MSSPNKRSVKERALRTRFKNLLARARREGFVMMAEVAKPAAIRQALSLSSLYLRPLDGSDLQMCSCCGHQYQPQFKSRLWANYLPLNWCPSCKERLREGMPEQVVYDLPHHVRRRKQVGRAKLAADERRIKDFLTSRAGSRPGPTHAEAVAARGEEP